MSHPQLYRLFTSELGDAIAAIEADTAILLLLRNPATKHGLRWGNLNNLAAKSGIGNEAVMEIMQLAKQRRLLVNHPFLTQRVSIIQSPNEQGQHIEAKAREVVEYLAAWLVAVESASLEPTKQVDANCNLSDSTASESFIAAGFADELTALSDAIDVLHESGSDVHDRALYPLRENVISLASRLCRSMEPILQALEQQGMLTGERKGALADLSVSLDFIAHLLRSSMANNWGYRITEEAAPPEVVKEWNGHWHMIRHMALKLRKWAEVMGNEPAGAVDQQQSKAEIDGIGAPKQLQTRHQVKQKAEAIVKSKRGEWPGVNELYRQIGCAKGTVLHAIADSPYLNARKAEHDAAKQANSNRRTMPLTDPIIDETDATKQAELKRLMAEQAEELDREERQDVSAKRSRSRSGK